MGHPQVYRAAVGGKRRANSANRTEMLTVVGRLIFAGATLVLATVGASTSYAQSAAFAGMAGNWSGAGTVTLDDGSTERIRCRASYAVRADGNGLNQSLTCASDSYKFNLSSNVLAEGGSLSGTWTESSRNVSGNLEGRGSNGSFQVVASAPGFTANLTLTTHGNRQSVVIKSDSAIRTASISMSRY
jgi:hypothetical protein